MIRRMQYRCSFRLLGNDMPLDNIIDRCRERFEKLIKEGRVCNASFYRYENMGFLYVEEIISGGDDGSFAISKYSGEGPLNVENIMSDLNPYLKPWPRED